jgi:hypothetical protein
MACTLVSAFYPIKSKFNKNRYMEWGKMFMQLECPIIFFTESELIPELQAMRGDKPIRFIIKPFNKLNTWLMYKNNWIENHKIDPENNYHTPELYSIWAEKVFFVEEAIVRNDFKTQFFFWCDFGAFRNPNIERIIIDTFPSTMYFSNDKLILQSISDLKYSDRIIKTDGIYGELISHTWNETRLVGGLWGGSATACLNWKNAYHTMLDKYFRVGRFAGKDQMIMLSTYLDNPKLATVVKSTKTDIDEWFFLEYLLSDMNIKFERNSTYILE